MRDLLEEIELADQVGLDVFGVGEHHRPDFVVSAPAVVLAAAARTTERIRLTSAVSVISSDDPIRVFQDFATLDLISGGRAEIMAGRGSFIESFGLFGYDLEDYDELFANKLARLLDGPLARRPRRLPAARAGPAAGLDRGRRQPAERGARRPARACRWRWRSSAATRSASRRSPSCTAARRRRAATTPAALDQLARLHRRALAGRGATTSFPAFKAMMDRIGRERGWPPLTREQYLASHELRGANFVGSPDQIVEKILFQHEIFKHDRFLLQMSVGTLPHADVLRAIELLGTEVAPKVRAALAQAAKR